MRGIRRGLTRGTAAVGAVVLLGGLVASAPAAATPGQGVTTTDVVIGTLDGPARAQQDGVSLRASDDETVRTATLTYVPGAYSGWHHHPGIVLATVQSGTIVRQVGCHRPELLTAGDSFTEVEEHYVRNFYAAGDPGAVDAVLRVTQIYPRLDDDGHLNAARVEEDPPTCGRGSRP